MKRQLDDYFSKFYGKAKRFHALAENNYAKVKEIAKWKEEVAENGILSRSYQWISVQNFVKVM